MWQVITFLLYALFMLLILPFLALYAVGWLLQLPWLVIKDWMEETFTLF